MSENVKKQPRLGLAERQLNQTELDFMKVIEAQNIQRVQKLQKHDIIFKTAGGILAGTVFGIYLYSMFSVKQEKFLDDFEEPKKINIESS